MVGNLEGSKKEFFCVFFTTQINCIVKNTQKTPFWNLPNYLPSLESPKSNTLLLTFFDIPN